MLPLDLKPAHYGQEMLGFRYRFNPALYLDSFPCKGENPRLIPGGTVGKSHPA